MSNKSWGLLLGLAVAFSTGVVLGSSAPAEARSPSSGGSCSQEAFNACVNSRLLSAGCRDVAQEQRCMNLMVQTFGPQCTAERRARGCPE